MCFALVQLRRFKLEEGFTNCQLAEYFQTTENVIKKILSGFYIPSPELQKRINLACGLCNDWLDDDRQYKDEVLDHIR